MKRESRTEEKEKSISLPRMPEYQPLFSLNSWSLGSMLLLCCGFLRDSPAILQLRGFRYQFSLELLSNALSDHMLDVRTWKRLPAEDDRLVDDSTGSREHAESSVSFV